MSSKVIVKKNLVIFKNPNEWDAIWKRIRAEHGPTISISFVMKRELGFTVRKHTEWVPFDRSGDRVRYYAEEQVHLDFFNESAHSWFQLKYLNLN